MQAAEKPRTSTLIARLTMPGDPLSNSPFVFKSATDPGVALLVALIDVKPYRWTVNLIAYGTIAQAVVSDLKPGTKLYGDFSHTEGSNYFELRIMAQDSETNEMRVLQTISQAMQTADDVPEPKGQGKTSVRLATIGRHHLVQSPAGIVTAPGSFGCSLEIDAYSISAGQISSCQAVFEMNHPAYEPVEVVYKGDLPDEWTSISATLLVLDEQQGGSEQAMIVLDKGGVVKVLKHVLLMPKKTVKETQVPAQVKINAEMLPIRMKQLANLIPYNVTIATRCGHSIYELTRDASGALFATHMNADKAALPKPHYLMGAKLYETFRVQAPIDMFPDCLQNDLKLLKPGITLQDQKIMGIPVRLRLVGDDVVTMDVFTGPGEEWFDPEEMEHPDLSLPKHVQAAYCFTPQEIGLNPMPHTYMLGGVVHKDGKSYVVVEVEEGLPTKLFGLVQAPIPEISDNGHFVMDGLAFAIKEKQLTSHQPMEQMASLDGKAMIQKPGKPLITLSMTAIAVGSVTKPENLASKGDLSMSVKKSVAIFKEIMGTDSMVVKCPVCHGQPWPSGVCQKCNDEGKVVMSKAEAAALTAQQIMDGPSISPKAEDEINEAVEQAITDKEFVAIHGHQKTFAQSVHEAVSQLQQPFPGTIVISLDPDSQTQGPNAVIDIPASGGNHKLNWDAMAATILSVPGLMAILTKEIATDGGSVFRVQIHSAKATQAAYDQSPAKDIESKFAEDYPEAPSQENPLSKEIEQAHALAGGSVMKLTPKEAEAIAQKMVEHLVVGVDLGSEDGDSTVIALKKGDNIMLVQPCYADGAHNWLTMGETEFCNTCGIKKNQKAGTVTLPKAPAKGEDIQVSYAVTDEMKPIQRMLEKLHFLRPHQSEKPSIEKTSKLAAKLMQKINLLTNELKGSNIASAEWKGKFETLQAQLLDMTSKAIAEDDRRDRLTPLKARFENLASGLGEESGA